MYDLDWKKYISLEEASKRVPYSSAYLRLRILQKKLKAIKKGKSWVTTQEWLDEYMRHVRAWEEFQLENGIGNGRKKGGRAALSRKVPQAIVASSPERHLEDSFKLQEHGAEHIGVVSEPSRTPASVIDAREDHVQSFDESFLGIPTADQSVESRPLGMEISSVGTKAAVAEGGMVSDLVPIVEEAPRRVRTFSQRVAKEFSSREVNPWLRRRISAGGLPPIRITRPHSFTSPVRFSLAVLLLAAALTRGGFLDMRNLPRQMSESGEKVRSLSASFGEEILSRSSRLASSILSFRPADLLPAPSSFYPSSSFQYASLLTPFGQRVGNAVTQTVSLIQNAWGDMVAYFLPEQRIAISQESVSPDRSGGEEFGIPADQTDSSPSSSLSTDISIYTSSRAPPQPPTRSDLASSVGVTVAQDPQLLSRLSSLESGREQELTRILNLASTLLSVAEKANQAQSSARSSITIVNQSQKIDTLTEASALKGFTVSSGNLAVSNGTFSVSGAATLSSDATIGGNTSIGGNLTVSGTGTSTFAGPVTIAGAFTAQEGSLTISSTSTVTTQFTVTKVPTAVHTFVTWAPDVADSNVTGASLLLNPASAASDTNLFGLAVGDLPKFIVDAEGDVFAKSVTLSGGATLASTTISGTLTIEANTFLGDAPNNDSTVVKGITSIYATSSAPALSIWNSTPGGSLLSLSTGATAPTSIFKVSAGGQTTIGTTTVSGLSILTLTSTTTDSIPLSIKGVTNQSANLFSILSSTDASLFSISGSGLTTLTNASSTQLSSTQSSYFATSGGSVGIGTTSPSSLLSVHGNSYVSGTSFFGGAITGTSTASFGTTTVTNLISTNTSTSTFAGGIQAPYLSLTGTSASSTVSGGFRTGGISSSNGLTLTGGSILASAVNALIGSTTITNLTVTNIGTSTFSGGLEIAQLHTTAGTSTFSNGIQLSAGCFRDISGTCLSPVTLGGSNTNVQFNNNGSLGGDANFIWDNSAKRFGLGTSSPSSLLSVHGNSYISGTGFFGGAITGTSTASFGTTTVTNLISTNVSTSTFAGGIESSYLSLTGTAASSTVSGGFQTAGFSSSNGLTLTGGSFLASAVNALIGSTTVTNLTVSNTSSSTFAGPITHSTGDLIVARGGSGNLLLNPYGGKVGVGISAPRAPLDVNSDLANGATLAYFIDPTMANDDDINLLLGQSTGANTGFVINYRHNSTAASRKLIIGTAESWASTENLVMDGTGNVGIGTTSPSGKLAIQGSGIGNDVFLRSANGNLLVYNTGGAGDTFYMTGATVGIGTTNPTNRLDVRSSTVSGGSASNGNVGMFYFTNDTQTESVLGVLSDAAPATTWRFGQFYSDMNGTPDAEFVFRGDGTPLSDNAATTPADFAEWLRVVGSPGGYEPGDLVMYAVSANRRVEKATKDSEEYLAGVVTLKPGMVGVSYDIGTDVTDAVGDKDYLELEALYNAKMIAMIGLTPVKVTTENGPLQSGDPITVSSIPGIGMRAEPGDKIIGYAMEAFDPASGEMGTHDVDLPTPIQDQPFHPKTTATTLPNGQSGYKGWVFAHVNLGYSKLDSSTSQVASDTTTNAWSVDQQSGKVNVNFFGNMNMQGNNVLDVGSISGMFGKWKIDADGTLTTVKVVTNEVLTEALSVKSSFELGSMEKPAGMTVYDRTTGEPYCVGIDIGEWFRQKGKCTSVPLSSQSLNSGSSASTSDQVATTTPSASSSEIVSDTLPVEMLSGDTASTTATTTEP